MKTALVTGATSQAGIALCNYLKSIGEEIRVVAAVRNLDNPLLKEINPDSVHQFDLSDSYSINSIISGEKPDYVFNCAAASFVGSSNQFPYLHFKSNVQAVIHILEAVKNLVPECRVVTFGSSEQFGGSKSSHQSEEEPPSPINFYGVSKCCSHMYVKAYRDIYGLFAIQNYSYNFESKFRSESFVLKKIAKGLKKMSEDIRSGKQITPLYLGNVRSSRDFSHVDDVVRAYWLSANNDKPTDYVIGSGKSVKIYEFISLCLNELGINGKYLSSHQIPTEKYNSPVFELEGKPIVYSIKKFYRDNDPSSLSADSLKIKKELGWKPEKGIIDIIKDFLG